MRKSKSGFTIVELLVVTIVIVILATITTTAYLGYQNRARTKQFEATLQLVASFERNYYKDNGEYLSTNDMIGSASSGSLTDADYASIASKTGIDQSALKNNTMSLVPVKGSNGTQKLSDKSKLYLMTRNNSNNGSYTFNIGESGCSVYLNPKSAGNEGTTEYVMSFFDAAKDKWVSYKSANGTVDYGSCSFAGTL